LIDRLKREGGYSLVEVMASIMILTVAILPMVGMFDAGLRSASTSGNYDKARALANANLETVKTMRPSVVRALTGCPRGADPGFTCSVVSTPVYIDAAGEFQTSEPTDPKDMLRVEITVSWGGGNSYSAIGLVAR